MIERPSTGAADRQSYREIARRPSQRSEMTMPRLVLYVAAGLGVLLLAGAALLLSHAKWLGP